ncbi:hypothetical protein [Actinacidiphila sp. bgisy167]|uniref:hypothetical protein n=1 Tax=Actinacidiphila sp. bgisy167 TaxID=3413797 RepID=UPI003D74D4C0
MPPIRREPHPSPLRPTGVLPGPLRKATAVALLTVSLTALTAACDRQRPAAAPADNAGGGPSASATATAPVGTERAPSVGPTAAFATSPPVNGMLSTRRVYVTETTRPVPAVHTVLDDERDLGRFPGYFMASAPQIADAIAERAARTDFSRSVLVAWSRTTGCAGTKDAMLFRSGDRLVLGLAQQPGGPCLAAHRVVTVFEVPRDRMPKRPRFAQEADPLADPPAPGRTLAFGGLEDTREPGGGRRAAEVTSARQLDAFLAGLPRTGAAALREQLARQPRRTDERRFAFVLTGCRPTGAALAIGRREISAAPTGDEHIRCIQAQSFAAVLAVPSRLVPTRVQLID